MRTFIRYAGRLLKILSLLTFIALALVQEGPPPGVLQTQINQIIASETFDYLGWELGALYVKGSQMSVPTQNYLTDAKRKELVLRYFDLIQQADLLEQQIAQVYSDPTITDPETASADQRARYSRLRVELGQMQSTVEGIIESQVATILAEQGFALGGQVLPPVKFRFSPLPQQFIISPRNEIRRMHEFSLEAGFTADRAEALEDKIDRQFNVSSLVVPLGGMGLYPTMLLETSSIEWTVSVVAHEWAHNWLIMFPLGWHYDSSPELRTMNETAASIVENEIGPLVLARFYPELVRLPEPLPQADPSNSSSNPEPEPAFSFRKEMRITRIQVDQLLKEGKITEAEEYMEARRQLFWEQGYQLRKLNQAYFAFHGAYADEPGAAGKDPVGPAVVQLRQQSRSLKAFLLRLAPMTAFEDLVHVLDK